MRTIDEYVATLSEKEKEQHKELIEECRKREKEILETTYRSKFLLQTLKQINEEFTQKLQELHIKIIHLQETYQFILERLNSIAKQKEDKPFYVQ